jgi:cytochrome c peroxidase
MKKEQTTDAITRKGFNLYMSKAQCATCHFLPSFGGVKPPFTGNEFEVIGVPGDKQYSRLSNDSGRYQQHLVPEMLHAFRTTTLRNTGFTAPYMHNGVFTNLAEVIDFYDGGGGAGHGLIVDNQTLSSDSLRLTQDEKYALEYFIRSLSNPRPVAQAPEKLPASKIPALNQRVVGGTY